jgi:hypothetical protein
MPQTLETEITAALAYYLAGDLTLDEFVRWFSAASWNVQQLHRPTAENLTYATELALAEMSEGSLSVPGLRTELAGLIRRGGDPQGDS